MAKIDRQTEQCIVLAVLVFLAVVGLSACSLGIQSPPEPPPPIFTGALVGVPGVGLPAIHHHGKGTLTPDEVRKFVLSHQFPVGPTTTGQPPTILGIEFITAKAASAKLQGLLRGRSMGLLDTATVIDVELRGPFAFSSAALKSYKQPFIIQDAVEVFDAATGNLLFYGPIVG